MKTQKKTLSVTSLVMSCLLFAASMASAGHYYESATTNREQAKQGGREETVKAWVDGDSARVEFVSGAKEGWTATGNYLVTTDGGENVYLVNPKEETYGRFNMEEMMATLGAAMNMMEQMGGMVKMEFTDVSGEKLSEEPGGSILGHSTTHSRYQTNYTMSMKMMGFKQQNKVETIQDIWATSDLEARGFGVWLRPDRGMKTGNEGLDGLMNQEFKKLDGFPLKMVMESTTTNKKGKTQKSTSTVEVTVLREESIADGTFEWPSHFTETEIIPNLEGMQAGDQQTDDGKKKKKKGLSGLFNKPDDDG